MRIIFTGGGTSGHLFPILAVIRQLKKLHPEAGLKLFYIGPKDEEAASLLKKEGVVVKKILAGKLRRYFSLYNLLDIIKTPIGILQSLFYLFFFGPDAIFSKGGYGSFPVVFMAWIFGIPIFLHESDVVPGLASKIQAKWALEIFISFPQSAEYFEQGKAIWVGNPTRDELFPEEVSCDKASEILNLQGDKPLVLIWGGSQGSRNINDILLSVLPEILQDLEILHQTGKNNFKRVKAEAEALIAEEQLKKYYHPFAFLGEDELKYALNCCKLVVSRAGAGSIFEIARAEKPSILVPLTSSAQDHQLKNAYTYARTEAAEVIEEKNLTPHFFLEKLKYLISNKPLLEKMSENARLFARPKAAEIIASYMLEYLK